MTHLKTSFLYRPEVKCPFCETRMSKIMKVADGIVRPTKEGVMTCTNPICNVTYDSNTNTATRKGKVINEKW